MRLPPNQLHRTLGVTLKTAWFMSHRIRLAMAEGGLGPLGGGGATVEADETYFGQKEGPQQPSPQRKGRPYTKGGKTGPAGKRAVVSLVQRGGSACVGSAYGGVTWMLRLRPAW